MEARCGVNYVLIDLDPVEYRSQSGDVSYSESISLQVATHVLEEVRTNGQGMKGSALTRWAEYKIPVESTWFLRRH